MKKATISVVNPNEVVVELSCQMRVETWLKVRDALMARDVGHYEHDVSEFRQAVDEAIRKVQQDFCGFGSEGSQ